MNKGISFFLGLLMGILICVLIYYFDTKMFKHISKQNKEKETVTHIITDTVYVETLSKQKKQNTNNDSDTTRTEENSEEKPTEDEVSIYDSEFSFDKEEQDDIFLNQLLKTKTVKVKVLSQNNGDVKSPENFFQYFEVQQWNTPIKNKFTYYRNQNMLKIKGVEIDNINVVFWNNTYLLEIGNRYYNIPETENFERMNLIHLP